MSSPRTSAYCSFPCRQSTGFRIRESTSSKCPTGKVETPLWSTHSPDQSINNCGEALQYLKNTVIADKITKHSQSAEAERHYNYPYAALEEALSNAVYHKGYDSREPIEVRVLPNRIEVLSHPGADRSISLEGLRTFRAVSRRYRNRRVGEFLKELHLTEGRNTVFIRYFVPFGITVPPIPYLKRTRNAPTSSPQFTPIRKAHQPRQRSHCNTLPRARARYSE